MLFTATSDTNDTVENLWAINPDGTGLTKILDEYVRTFSIQPSGTLAGGVWIACVIQAGRDSPDVTLELLHLPDREIRTITPLMNEKAGVELSPYHVTGGANPVWSPDGTQLAFIGQIDGPTLDAYRYDLASGALVRLSSGEAEADRLMWSPDQKWVIHQGYHLPHGEMGFPPVEGIWAASADGTGSVPLYERGKEPDARVIDPFIYGWSDPLHLVFLIDHYDGEASVRSADISTGEVTTIVAGEFDSAAPSSDFSTWLLAPRWAPDPNEIHQPTRLFKQGQIIDLSAPAPVLEQIWQIDSTDYFMGVTREKDCYSVSQSGEVTKLPLVWYWNDMGSPVTPSPDRTLWAWYSSSFYTTSELWVGPPLQTPGYVAGRKQAVRGVRWSPDSQAILYFNYHGVWIARRPDFTPTLLVPEWNTSSWNAGSLNWIQ